MGKETHKLKKHQRRGSKHGVIILNYYKNLVL